MVLDEREFVIERLFKGSIINFDTFMMKQKAIVNMRFVQQGSVKTLQGDKMKQLMSRDEKLQDNCLKYLVKKSKSKSHKPLDYVLCLSEKIMKKIFQFYHLKLCYENEVNKTAIRQKFDAAA